MKRIDRSHAVARLAAVLALPLLLSSCWLTDSLETVGAREIEDSPEKVSVESLRRNDPQSPLGAKEDPKIIEANGGAYRDQNIEQLLALITGALVEQSNDPGRTYKITILDTPSVNAFALPGGYLYVTRGLMALANDASEIAAVVSHEMSHVAANHGIDRVEQAKAVDIAERVVQEVVSNELAGKLAKASTERKLASFSQNQELQADALGIKLAGKAGFDPFAAARFLRSMKRWSAYRSLLNAGDEADLAATHPSTPRRVELAERHARAIGPRGTGEKNRSRFLKGIDGMMFGDKTQQGFVRGRRFSHKKLGITFTVPKGFDISNRTEAALASGPGEMAVRFDGVPRKNGQKPVDYIASGWVNGLDPASVRSATINGLNAATASAAAGDWIFDITVFADGRRFHRFIVASPRNGPPVTGKATEIRRSFRRLKASEKANLKPLRLKIITAKTGDTIASLASRMQGPGQRVNLFRALNALDQGDRIKPGDKLKIVTQ